MADEFDALVAEDARILDVELTTAHALSDTEFRGILAQIEKASGRKVQATRSVDEALIGGLVLQAGSMRLDASVRGRLERLRQELATARS
jgi:F-type H+-transporting ATPase subunit delta